MTEFQALITGAIHGALLKADADGPFMIDVEIGVDEGGNYTNEIRVEGRQSHEVLLVTVELGESEGPETDEERVEIVADADGTEYELRGAA